MISDIEEARQFTLHNFIDAASWLPSAKVPFTTHLWTLFCNVHREYNINNLKEARPFILLEPTCYTKSCFFFPFFLSSKSNNIHLIKYLMKVKQESRFVKLRSCECIYELTGIFFLNWYFIEKKNLLAFWFWDKFVTRKKWDTWKGLMRAREWVAELNSSIHIWPLFIQFSHYLFVTFWELLSFKKW